MLSLFDLNADCYGHPADVFFVLDASNSIWKPDFVRQLEFVKSVVGLFHVGQRWMQVGVLTFADDPQVQFHLNYYRSKVDVEAAVENIRHDGGYHTNTAEALRYERERRA